MTKEQALFLDYLEHNLNYSLNTIKSYSQDITLFEDYLIDNNLDYRTLKRDDIRGFMASRLKTQNLRGNKESPRTLRRRISALKKYYDYLYNEKMVESNPFLLIVSPKNRNKLPEVLYESQIQELLEVNSERTDDLMIRDQALLELMYSSGLRCSEVINLKTSDIEFSTRYMRILGKGNKERIVPFSKEAKQWMLEYARKSRPYLLKDNNKDLRYEYFFLNNKGNKLTSRGLEYILDQIVVKTGLNLGFNLHPHVLRHSFATHLLNKGADLRVIQELMGHNSVGTTSIYVHVSKEKIKKEYDKYFPKTSKND